MLLKTLIQEVCETITKTKGLSLKSPDTEQLTTKGWLS